MIWDYRYWRLANSESAICKELFIPLPDKRLLLHWMTCMPHHLACNMRLEGQGTTPSSWHQQWGCQNEVWPTLRRLSRQNGKALRFPRTTASLSEGSKAADPKGAVLKLKAKLHQPLTLQNLCTSGHTINFSTESQKVPAAGPATRGDFTSCRAGYALVSHDWQALGLTSSFIA